MWRCYVGNKSECAPLLILQHLIPRGRCHADTSSGRHLLPRPRCLNCFTRIKWQSPHSFVPSQRIPDASLCSVRSATTISWAEHWDEDGDNRDRVADKTLLYPSSSSSSSWLSPCPGATVLEETGAPSRVPETRVMQFPITLTASLFHEDDEDGYDNWIRRNMADTLFRTHNY